MSIINEILNDILFDDDVDELEQQAKQAQPVAPAPTPTLLEDEDDRHFCSECKNFSTSTEFCFVQRCRLIDDIPRRCQDFVDIKKTIH